MNIVNVILMGFGHVGKAFTRLVQQRRKDSAERYGFQLRLVALFKSRGGLLLPEGTAFQKRLFVRGNDTDIERNPFWKEGRILDEAFEAHQAGVMVECTPSNIKTGEPALQFIHQAMDKGWHVVTANKGPLVVDFHGIQEKAEKNRVSLGMSGATAAALPALDIALHSLAGTKVSRVEGILNGTTNYILTRMGEGEDYATALQDAQQKGIAEPDPSLDVEGWDTAVKILIITNAIFRTANTLADVRVEGITHIPSDLLEKAKKKSGSLKLLGSIHLEDGKPKIEVRPCWLEPSHPMHGVVGSQKGITFFTDTMGAITLTGGKSDPKGAAAALLKDIINIQTGYRL
jgi:homoserine dehydrogenase